MPTRPASALPLGLLLVCAGCELFEEDKDPGPPSPPVMTVLSPTEPVVAAPGEPITVRVAVRDASGAPYEGYTAAWRFPFWFSLNPEGQCTASTTEPGVEECVYRTTQRGHQGVTLEVSRCTGTRKEPKLHCDTWTSPEARVFVWGGEARAVHTPFREATLVVGEERPLQAVVLSDKVLSHIPPSYRTADPNVASVDEHGVVRALAVGETTLVIAAGEARREVRLEVREGPSGPPPIDTAVPVVRAGDDTVASTRVAELGVNRRREGTLTVDGEGMPWLVYRTSTVAAGVPETELRNAWVSTWTGSGFSFEAVGVGWDDLAYPRVAIDGEGVAWVLYHSRVERAFGLMRRLAPGRWERVILPGGSDPRAAHVVEESGAFMPSALSDRLPLDLMPRERGGVHAVYAVFSASSEAEQAASRMGCARSLRLATVEASGRLEVEDVRRESYGLNTTDATTCGTVAGLEDLVSGGLALAPDPQGDSPIVLLFEELENQGFVEATRRTGERWETRMLVPWAGERDEGYYTQRPIQLGLARAPADDPTGQSWLVWQGGGVDRFFLASFEELWAGSPRPVTDFIIRPAPRDGVADSDIQLSATRLADAVIVCTREAETLWRLDAAGSRLIAPSVDPTSVGAASLLRGLSSDTTHLHLSWGLGDLTWARTALP